MRRGAPGYAIGTMRFAILLGPILLCLVSCGGSAPPPEAPPPVEPPTAPPPPPEPVDTTEPPEPPDEPPPPPPERVKSTSTIGGTSITEVTGEEIVAALQKLGWAPENVAITGGTVGKYENLRMGIATAKLVGHLEIVRPAAEPTGSSASMMPPKDQKAMHESTAAVYLDPTADVVIIIVVEGKQAEAKKLLDKLVKK